MRIKLEKMNRLKMLNLVLLVLLALAAGSAKIARTPEELGFFQQFGLSELVLVVFGAVQILAALLMIRLQFRVVGLGILSITFVISTAMIFASGQLGFGIFSLLPIMMILFAYKLPLTNKPLSTTEA